MSATEVKDDRKYTKEHEWALLDGNVLTVGITAFAVEQLGDVTLVNFDVAPGETIQSGKPFGTIESVKTLSDLFAPISAEVIEINTKLENEPELVNSDCWGAGWMIKVRCNDPGQVASLLSASAYLAHTEAEH